MDLLDRLLGHDASTTGELIAIASSLTDGQLDTPMPLSKGSIRAELDHIVRNMEAWSDLMHAKPVRASAGDSMEQLRNRLDRAAFDLNQICQSVAGRNAWDETWTDPHESPLRSRSFGGTIAHVITHSMHHRAHVLVMLRSVGVTDLPEGDVLNWERRHR